MATNSIGAGTCNFPVNIRVEERLVIGQAAFAAVQSGKYRSVGDAVKAWYLRGLEMEDANAAAKIRAIRGAVGSTTLLLLLGWATATTWLGGETEPMRRASRVRVRREMEVAA